MDIIVLYSSNAYCIIELLCSTLSHSQFESEQPLYYHFLRFDSESISYQVPGDQLIHHNLNIQQPVL